MDRFCRMVADIGGTNTRIGLFDPGSDELRAVVSYKNRDYSGLEDVIATWLGGLNEAAPEYGCIAVAAPPSSDRVTMSNLDWSFSPRDLARRFGFHRLGCINDFESNAYSLPHLRGDDLLPVCPGEPGRPGALATVGPGTGLGGAVLERPAQGAPRARACEPGHAGLSPATEQELAVFALLLPRHDNIYAELLVSGPGLLRLYQALAEIRGAPARALGPEEVSRLALDGEDELCTAALDMFCALLGSACGDFLLANGCYGGLYLAGGILPRMIPFLRASTFHQRLQAKGAMRDHLAQIPVYVITCAHPGLIGAAHAPL